MKARTSQGEKLKRLIRIYVNCAIDNYLEAPTPEEDELIHGRLIKARKAVYDAIDELTSVDFAPRAIQDLL